MDLFGLFRNMSQDRQIRNLQETLDQNQQDRNTQEKRASDLAAENDELKLRLALLVHLLIEKGLITAEEYASLIAKTK